MSCYKYNTFFSFLTIFMKDIFFLLYFMHFSFYCVLFPQFSCCSVIHQYENNISSEAKSTEVCDFCHFLSHPILKGLSELIFQFWIEFSSDVPVVLSWNMDSRVSLFLLSFVQFQRLPPSRYDQHTNCNILLERRPLLNNLKPTRLFEYKPAEFKCISYQ